MNLLIAFALGATVLWALFALRLGTGRQESESERLRKAQNRARYEAELQRIQAAEAAAEISAEDAAAERNALQQALVAAASDGPQWQPSLGLGSRFALLLLPLAGAVGAYVVTNGEQHWPEASTASSAQQPDVEAMVSGLAARLEQDPDDLRGWMMLGRSYMVMNRYADAAKAYAEANARNPEPNADLMIAEAEALALSRDRDLLGRPEQLLNQALQLNPQHIRGLWYAGLAATQRDDRAGAMAYFERLQAQPDLPPELQAALAEMGFDQAPPPQAEAGRVLLVDLELAPALEGQTPPGGTLFVYAREYGGPPMPLAVQRVPLGAFPRSLQLDDSMSMLEGRNLSAFEDIEIVARISASGGAQAGSGDWQGTARVQAPSSGTRVPVQIDTILP